MGAALKLAFPLIALTMESAFSGLINVNPVNFHSLNGLTPPALTSLHSLCPTGLEYSMRFSKTIIHSFCLSLGNGASEISIALPL